MVQLTQRRPITKKKKVVATKKIHQIMGHPPDPCSYEASDKFITASLVGVEIELEGIGRVRINDDIFNSHWNVIEDGSLRDGGVEFVLTRPFAGKDLENALNSFDKQIAKGKRGIKISERTSVHIHIDVRDLTYEQLTRFISIYAIFEEALFNFVGKNRKGNIFSTSFANAEGNLHKLGSFGDNPNDAEIRHTIMHFTKYSACNVSAVQKYGSLEFRNHEGTYDIERITKWINILLLMKKASIDLEIPVQDLFTRISETGTQNFFTDVFHEYSNELDYPNLEFDMYAGLRLAQDIIHSQNLESGVSVPTSDKMGESVFAKYYRKRKPKRFKERFNDFCKGKIDSSDLWTGSTYGGPHPHNPRHDRDLQRAVDALRRANGQLSLDIVEGSNSADFELQGE